MRSAKLLAVTVLAVVLALSAAQNAFATVQLYYDNGTEHAGYIVDYGGVLFSLPSGVSSAHLTYVRWSVGVITLPLTIYVTKPDHVTQLSGSPIVLPGAGLMPAGTGCPGGWGTCRGLDVSSWGIIVTGDFFVILYKAGNVPEYDTGPLVLPVRSFYGDSLAGLWNSPDGNFLIRVDVDPIAPPVAPVGGIVVPVDKIAVLGPWLAVIGLVGCVTAVAVVAKKRQ